SFADAICAHLRRFGGRRPGRLQFLESRSAAFAIYANQATLVGRFSIASGRRMPSNRPGAIHRRSAIAVVLAADRCAAIILFDEHAARTNCRRITTIACPW